MRRAFTFIEVMFAMILLGTGMVMLAATLPVAIEQTRSTSEETTATAVAETAAGCLDASVPDGATAASLTDDSSNSVQRFDEIPQLWDRIKGQLICESDPRFAWVPLFRRMNDNVAQVIFIVARCDNRARYDPRTDLAESPDAVADAPCTLQPHRLSVSIGHGAAGRDEARFDDDGSGSLGAIAPGTYIVIAKDPLGAATGEVYRVGNPIDAAGGVWELAPGNDLKPDQPTLNEVPALVLGRGYADPANPSQGYGGRAQDLAVFSTFVRFR